MTKTTAATVTAGERHANNVPATGKPKLNVRLLRRVQKHILEEPLRFDMNVFANTDFANPKAQPPCGTAGCIAGWALILSGEPAKKIEKLRLVSTASRGAKILGLSYKLPPRGWFGYTEWNDRPSQAVKLFDVNKWPSPFREDYIAADRRLADDHDELTRREVRSLRLKMAKAAVARIDHFIKTKGAE